MAEKLTPQQKMAVDNRGGNLLVSAAAGSGKTKVLVDRLLSYLADPIHPADIDSFLIITYTKAAAAELRGKIASKLSERIAADPNNKHLRQQMQRLYLTKISTVHSFCADLLKEYAYMLDFSGDFRVADENECLELQATALETVLNTAYEGKQADPDFYAFVDSQGLGRNDMQIPHILLAVYRKAKCHLDFEGWLDWCLAATKTAGITDVSQTVWGKYLLDDLGHYLDLQIDALTRCAQAADGQDNMQKPAALLHQTVDQLISLRGCNTWDSVHACMDIEYGTLSFSKKCEDTQLIEQIKAVRDACKKGLKKKLRRFCDASDRLLQDMDASASATAGLVKLVRSFDAEYTRLKRSRRILDFSDLEHKTLDLLLGRSRSGATAVAREVAQRYREVMVDEYQDSNAVQDAIFGALTAKQNNCFMVGDVKQSIYQFRLADPGIFLDKYHRYEDAQSAQPGQGRKVLLSKNFRSSGAVIEAVNDVFYDCMFQPVGGLRYTEQEALSEGIPHCPLQGPEVELYGIEVQSDTYREEASFVARRIRQLLDGKHMIRDGDTTRVITPEDIVILLRSPGSVGRMFQNALEQQGVMCNTDSGTELMEAEEVQFIFSMLQVISNPLQDIPLLGVLGSRVFGFTADELARIRSKDLRAAFYTVLQMDDGDKTAQFLRKLDQLRLDARMYDLPQLIDRIFLLTDADSIFASMPDGMVRVSNLRTLCQLAESFSVNGQGSLERFLDHLNVIAAEGIRVQSNQDSTGAVTIMSIHKSKGLEFPVVFLCGLSKAFNMEHTHEQVLCDSELGLGLSGVDLAQRLRYPTISKRAIAAKMQAESVSEELRVLYVAMTRPKDRLIMTYASSALEKELLQLSMRMDMSDPLLMASEVGSAGEWVLLAALRHEEAGAFHHFGRRPQNIRRLENPWLIKIVAGSVCADAGVTTQQKEHGVASQVAQKIQDGLSYQYPYLPATCTPSKQTATQLKGRYKDHEAAQGVGNRAHSFDFRTPSFASDRLSGRQYGSALHTVMQYIRYEACNDPASLEQEIARLVQERYISEDIAKIVDKNAILAFFKTDLGRKLCSGAQCLREFKFSLLDDAQRYMDGTEGDFVLLQGVVDCAIIEDGGITVIDFKTDRVPLSGLDDSVRRYTPQVKAYAYALTQIYNLPVVDVILYYFSHGKAVHVPVANQ